MAPPSSLLRRLGKGTGWGFVLLANLVASVALGQFVGLATPWAALVGIAIWGLCLTRWQLGQAALLCGGLLAAAVVGYVLQSPSNERDWKPEIARLPLIRIEENILTVENLRDFAWRSQTDFDENWTRQSYDLDALNQLDVIVVPFGQSELAAHVMLSFGFADGQRLALSVETRPERYERYSLVGGATRQLELIYLFGTERDLLGLRIFHRGNQVYAIPLRPDPAFAKQLLLELCASANRLHEQPAFYATLRHNCTTTLLHHVNRIGENRVPLQKEILFPAQLGSLLHRLELMDTTLPWPEAKQAFRVDEFARNAAGVEPFSKAIRSRR